MPFAAGGPTDVMARLIAQKLSEILKQQFYVENKPGAGGNIGMTQAARSAPDGYTILVASSSFTVNPSLYAKNPYDPYKDFAPITLAAASPNILVVNPELPVKTTQELIDLLKKEPGKYNIANPGVGTTPQLAGRVVQAGAQGRRRQRTVRRRGTGDPVDGRRPHQDRLHRFAADRAAGQGRQAACARRHLGKALAGSAGRADLGRTRHQGAGFRDHAGRAGAGRNAEGDRRQAQRGDRQGDGAWTDVKKRCAQLGFDPVANTPAEFATYIKTDVEKWAKVIKAAEDQDDQVRCHQHTALPALCRGSQGRP